MAVYVDDMNASFGRMKMCHMMADTTEELLTMADRIGVARKWLQKAGTSHEHFDIALSKKALAIQYGAIAVTRRDIGMLIRKRNGQSYDADALTCGGSGVVPGDQLSLF